MLISTYSFTVGYPATINRMQRATRKGEVSLIERWSRKWRTLMIVTINLSNFDVFFGCFDWKRFPSLKTKPQWEEQSEDEEDAEHCSKKMQIFFFSYRSEPLTMTTPSSVAVKLLTADLPEKIAGLQFYKPYSMSDLRFEVLGSKNDHVGLSQMWAQDGKCLNAITWERATAQPKISNSRTRPEAIGSSSGCVDSPPGSTQLLVLLQVT